MKKILNLIPIPDSFEIYAKYRNDDNDYYLSRCIFAGLYDDGEDIYPCMYCFDEEFGICNTEEIYGFSGYISPDNLDISFSKLIMTDCQASSRLGRLKNWLNIQVKEGRIK